MITTTKFRTLTKNHTYKINNRQGVVKMKILVKTITITFAFIALFSCSQLKPDQVNTDLITQTNIKNLHITGENVFASGQPSKEQFQVLASAGIKHIINLRPLSEQDWNEKAYIDSLGLTYHSIPVKGRTGITSKNAKALNELLNIIGSEPVLLHCASGNRVGALIALVEKEIKGNDVETEDAAGD